MLGWRLGAASGNCVITASGKFRLEDNKSPFREPFIFPVVCTAVSIVPGRMAKSSELSKFSLNRTQIRPSIFALGFMLAMISVPRKGGGGLRLRVGCFLWGSSTKQGQDHILPS